MATTIITKHSATAKDPAPNQLERGELAIDLERKNIYTKDASDEVVQLGGRPVKIGATAPPTPQEGDLWMEVPTAMDAPAMMWVYDGDKWLEHPSGVDGAPGADGADGNIADGSQDGIIATWDSSYDQWRANTAVTVNASGNMGIGVDDPKDILHVQGGSLRVQNPGAATIRIADTTDGFCESQISSVSEGTNRSSLILSTREGVNGVLPRLTIDATGDATFSGNVASETGRFLRPSNNSGIVISNAGLYPDNGTGNLGADASIDVGGINDRFKDGHFSGTVTADQATTWGGGVYRASGSIPNGGNGIYFNGNGVVPANSTGSAEGGKFDLGSSGFRWRTVYGTVGRLGTVITDTGVAISTRDLIETLSTLRNATKDETTLEGLRDAIGNAVGGLIEKFEAMQDSAVTQDIQESPVTQEITNED
jgi:hypothetical protein